MGSLVLLLATLWACLAVSHQLPDHWPKCSPSSRDYETCLTRVAELTISDLNKGTNPLGLPNIDPLVVPQTKFVKNTDSYNNVEITVRNVAIQGLKSAEDFYVRRLKDKGELARFRVDFMMPVASGRGAYSCRGFLFGGPIDDVGNLTVQMKNVAVNFVVGIAHGLTYPEIRLLSYEVFPGETSFDFDSSNHHNRESAKIMGTVMTGIPDQVVPTVRQGLAKSFVEVFQPYCQKAAKIIYQK